MEFRSGCTNPRTLAVNTTITPTITPNPKRCAIKRYAKVFANGYISCGASHTTGILEP